MVGPGNDPERPAEPLRRGPGHLSGAEFVLLALDPDHRVEGAGLGPAPVPAEERQTDQPEEVGTDDVRRFQRADRPEGEARDDEGPLRVGLPGEPDGRDEVVHLAPAMVVGARGGADTAEVEPQGGEREAVGQEPRGPVDHLRVHRAAVERMRVGHHGGPAHPRREPPARLEETRGARHGSRQDPARLARLDTHGAKLARPGKPVPPLQRPPVFRAVAREVLGATPKEPVTTDCAQ